MADEKLEQKPQETAADKPAAEGKPAEKAKSSILPYIIMTVIVIVCAGAGVGLGLLFAGGKKAQTAEPAAQENAGEQKKPEHPAGEKKPETEKSAGGEIWYFDLDPVVANLNEPGATRYVRAVLTLEMSSEINAEKGAALLAQKKPLITNLMTIYLSGLSVDATRGDKNLKRIQSELSDTFNERLFPDSKPLIKGILIKEFAVQ
jgi:flagellar basal body-associated protein FliL